LHRFDIKENTIIKAYVHFPFDIVAITTLATQMFTVRREQPRQKDLGGIVNPLITDLCRGGYFLLPYNE
jgi:hypothetical protein